jgi:hypothetical protein
MPLHVTSHFAVALTHTPLQSDSPGGQAHVPAEHCAPPVQGRSHPPQCRSLESVSTQLCLQAINAGAHDAAQTPLSQNGVVPLQRIPQPPQFAVSLAASTHAPAHVIVPLGHTQRPPAHA